MREVRKRQRAELFWHVEERKGTTKGGRNKCEEKGLIILTTRDKHQITEVSVVNCCKVKRG